MNRNAQVCLTKSLHPFCKGLDSGLCVGVRLANVELAVVY